MKSTWLPDTSTFIRIHDNTRDTFTRHTCTNFRKKNFLFILNTIHELHQALRHSIRISNHFPIGESTSDHLTTTLKSVNQLSGTFRIYIR